MYKRKTTDEYQLWTNYGYGWENECIENAQHLTGIKIKKVRVINDLRRYARGLQIEMGKAGTWKSTNERRQREIDKTISQIEVLTKSIKKVG